VRGRESAQDSQGPRPPSRSPRPPADPAEQPSQSAAPPAGDTAATTLPRQQVCNGSTVTLSGEDGAPAASSNQFPAGTKLKVTNLDNNKSTTVRSLRSPAAVRS
jgi:hypothetical protein